MPARPSTPARSSPAHTDDPDDPEGQAAQAGLLHVSGEEPGITRRRAGRGFSYRLPDGSLLRDPRTRARIRALAVPPAWTEVWICRSARGHLQATGRDARGRKQYRYHPDWQALRGKVRFSRLPDFAAALPRLRRRIRRDLKRDGLPRAKVLAIVVSLMMDTLVRVGNESYARENRSYGLTTLRDRHLHQLRGGRVRLRFKGKGRLLHEVPIDDPRLARLVQACQELPGQQLFQYRDASGRVRPLGSGDVNAYLREAMGGDFTAKDFRTWGATLHAFRCLAALPVPTMAMADLAPRGRSPRPATGWWARWPGRCATLPRYAAARISIRRCLPAGRMAAWPGRPPAHVARGSGNRPRAGSCAASTAARIPAHWGKGGW